MWVSNKRILRKIHLFLDIYKLFISKRSCWAFASIGSLEAAIFKKTGKSMSLSEQQLVDCTYTRDGCQGGGMSAAYDYLKKSIGSDKTSAYPVEYSQKYNYK